MADQGTEKTGAVFLCIIGFVLIVITYPWYGPVRQLFAVDGLFAIGIGLTEYAGHRSASLILSVIAVILFVVAFWMLIHS
ncbi:MAG: hypothetical protein WB789_10405 [Thermoplasmata archaeon]